MSEITETAAQHAILESIRTLKPGDSIRIKWGHLESAFPEMWVFGVRWWPQDRVMELIDHSAFTIEMQEDPVHAETQFKRRLEWLSDGTTTWTPPNKCGLGQDVSATTATPPPAPKPDAPALQQTDIAALIAERGKVYGDPRESHTNIGLSWTALLQQHYGITLEHPLPASMVAQMMQAMKNQRACRVYALDNYDDGEAYLRFARDFKQAEKPAHAA